MVGYFAEQIRRFKPEVVVGQAENGESGHPAHIFGVQCLQWAVECAGDPGAYPESAEGWGEWTVPKCYLHLYGDWDEMTVLDYDSPLERFGGASAWETARAAFRQCVSQFEIGRYQVYGTDSRFDGSRFGLFWTEVGPDTEKDDLFENLPSA